MAKQGLTSKERLETTTSLLGVIIGTSSNTIVSSLSIT